MPTDQEQTVDTGLVAPAASPQTSSGTPPTEAAAEPAPQSSEPVQIKGLDEDVTVKVTEINQSLAITQAAAASPAPLRGAPDAVQGFSLDTQLEAEADNLRNDFLGRLRQAQRPEDIPYKPPEPSVHIVERTRLEMEAGRARVGEFTQIEAARPKRAPNKSEGNTVAVLRPGDFVPDQRKGQGYTTNNSSRNVAV